MDGNTVWNITTILEPIEPLGWIFIKINIHLFIIRHVSTDGDNFED